MCMINCCFRKYNNFTETLTDNPSFPPQLREGLLDSMRCCVSTLQSRVQPPSASPSPSSSSEKPNSLAPSPNLSSAGDPALPTATPALRADVRMLRDAVDCARITLKEMEPWCQKLEGNKLVRCVIMIMLA